jgi:hypothetical protein
LIQQLVSGKKLIMIPALAAMFWLGKRLYYSIEVKLIFKLTQTRKGLQGIIFLKSEHVERGPNPEPCQCLAMVALKCQKLF